MYAISNSAITALMKVNDVYCLHKDSKQLTKRFANIICQHCVVAKIRMSSKNGCCSCTDIGGLLFRRGSRKGRKLKRKLPKEKVTCLE